MLKEFKEFALKGNMIDMAVGIIIGGAFGTIIKSLVADVIMPVAGMFMGGADFSNLFVVLGEGTFETLDAAKEAGVATLNYGVFINNMISFIILAFVIFMMVKQMNKLKKQPVPADPTTKSCDHCQMTVPIKATKCGHCTSQLAA